MPRRSRDNQPRRLLVVMPTWLGDCVMATPTLAALKSLGPDVELTALVRASVRPIVDALPCVDHLVTLRDRSAAGMARLARKLRGRRYDTAVLLPNSFRFAMLVAIAGIPRRVGYDRDGRGWLLTDRLLPRRAAGRFVPVPTIDYYLGLARYLGAEAPDPTLHLAIRGAHQHEAMRVLENLGADGGGRRPLVLLNPGGNFGSAKLWDPARFAGVADLCQQRFGARVAVTGAPKERPILDEVIAAAKTPVGDLLAAGMRLRHLKSVIAAADLLVTNDTGPRHIAAAVNTPVVTVFGPTDPAWTVIDFPHERQVRVDLPCSPCQQKQCPLTDATDHLACMKRVTAEMVFQKAAELLLPQHTTPPAAV